MSKRKYSNFIVTTDPQDYDATMQTTSWREAFSLFMQNAEAQLYGLTNCANPSYELITIKRD